MIYTAGNHRQTGFLRCLTYRYYCYGSAAQSLSDVLHEFIVYPDFPFFPAVHDVPFTHFDFIHQPEQGLTLQCADAALHDGGRDSCKHRFCGTCGRHCGGVMGFCGFSAFCQPGCAKIGLAFGSAGIHTFTYQTQNISVEIGVGYT